MHGVGEARSITQIVLEDAFGVRSLQSSNPLSSIIHFNQIKNKLLKGEPVQYVLGQADFYGLKFKVSPAVLIPRQETEELVHWILETLKKSGRTERTIRVLDIGTGSGCIPIALKKHLPFAEIVAWDISRPALEIAKENAQLNDVDIVFEEIDVLNLYPEKEMDLFDVIVSNPPYIPYRESHLMPAQVLDFEPKQALFVSNEDPLVFYRKIGELAERLLLPNGVLFFETNEFNGASVVQLLESYSYKSVLLEKDINGKPRMIKAIKHEK